jgi:hypothetical protein
MALSRVTNWTSGQTLTADALNAEFNNIINNAMTLVSPWTGPMDMNGFPIIIDADGDTFIEGSTDDEIEYTIAGFDDFRFSANLFTALSGSSISVVNGDITSTLGNLTVTDGQTTLTDIGSHTNTILTPLIVQAPTVGSPAAGIGTGILLKSESADENPSNVGQISAYFGDVGAGTEDSVIQLQTRVAGAALAPTFAFTATAAALGTFTHGNTIGRTYTLPDYDATLATVTGAEALTNKTINGDSNTITNIGTGELKTATGSLSGDLSGATTISMNDYAFFPNCQQTAVGTGNGAFVLVPQADDSTHVGRFHMLATNVNDTYVVRWRYVTASDMPEVWVAHDGSGRIVSVWASDDPVPGGGPGVIVGGCTSKRFTAQALEQLTALSGKASEAEALIRAGGLRMQHQAYRALQLLANKQAPSQWLYQNCAINTTTGRLEAK